MESEINFHLEMKQQTIHYLLFQKFATTKKQELVNELLFIWR